MQIFNLFGRGNSVDSAVAEKIGELDAFNYITNVPSKTHVKDTILSSVDGNSIGDELIDIMLGKDNGRDQKYSFEFTPTYNQRQPIFTKNTNGYKYVYTPGNDGMPVIVTAQNLSSSELKVFLDWKDGKFTVKGDSDEANFKFVGKVQYTEPSSTFIKKNTDKTDESPLSYVNENLFQIIEGEDNINSLIEMHDYITGDGADMLSDDNDRIKVSDAISKDDYKKYLGTYWLSSDDIDLYYFGIDKLNCNSYSDIEFDVEKFNNCEDGSDIKILYSKVL